MEALVATERIQRRIERLMDQVEEAADQEDWEAVRASLGISIVLKRIPVGTGEK